MKPTLFSKNKTLTSHDNQNMVETEHAKILGDVRNDGKYSGINGQPLPKGDKLIHYIESYKNRYEQLISKVL